MKKWSEEAWDVARPTYLKIIEHPFVEELARGTLAADKFLFYLRQDSLYLAHYSRVLTHIASRLTEKEHIAAFIRFASDGIEVEEALHGSFLKGVVPAPEEISPTCLLYTSVLQAQALAPVEVEAAAVLPCFWVYQQVGQQIIARQQEVRIPMHNGSKPMPTRPSPKRLPEPSESAMHWPKKPDRKPGTG
jgi:thiaminase/transcriptional activator TenA